ncbi:MAG: DivIVA domain-containing protein [Deltaproteobacteria bacterium]|jgi:cell division initiation protein
MKISPIDIQQQQFKGKMFGGLSPEDVDAFLQLVAREMEDLIRENSDIKEQHSKAVANEEEVAQRERDLRETLLAAQKIIEEMKSNAQKEATLLIAEAEINAEKLLFSAENRLAETKNEIQELRRQKLQFESSFKSLLDSSYKMLSLDGE